MEGADWLLDELNGTGICSAKAQASAAGIANPNTRTALLDSAALLALSPRRSAKSAADSTTASCQVPKIPDVQPVSAFRTIKNDPLRWIPLTTMGQHPPHPG